MQCLKEKVVLSVSFRIQGKEKQKIHFTNANTNNEKVYVPYHDIISLHE